MRGKQVVQENLLLAMCGVGGVVSGEKTYQCNGHSEHSCCLGCLLEEGGQLLLQDVGLGGCWWAGGRRHAVTALLWRGCGCDQLWLVLGCMDTDGGSGWQPGSTDAW